MGQALHPPIIACLPVVFPAVQGIAPQLPHSREAVRRAAGHRRGHIVPIQLKKLRMGPGIRAVHGHINGNISYDAHALAVGVLLKRPPLFIESKLQVLLELNIKI